MPNTIDSTTSTAAKADDKSERCIRILPPRRLGGRRADLVQLGTVGGHNVLPIAGRKCFLSVIAEASLSQPSAAPRVHPQKPHVTLILISSWFERLQISGKADTHSQDGNTSGQPRP